jgi:hypothetical protein
MTSTDLQLHRSISDIQSKISSIDASARRAAGPSPHRLLARTLACYVLGRQTARAPTLVAAQLYNNDARLLAALSSPGLIGKSAVAPAQTTVSGWASELATPGNLDLDFLQLLAPNSVYSQLSTRDGAIRVSLAGRGSVKVPSRAPSPSLAAPFIAQGAPIPVRQLGLSAASITPKKAAVISMFSEEMLKASTPSVERLIRAVMAFDTAVAIDGVLLGSTAATVISPPGLLAGVTPTAATAGGGLAAFAGDVRALALAIEATGAMLDPVLFMSTTSALLIAVLSLGGAANMPIIASANVPANRLIMLDAANFASAEGDEPDISSSNEVLLHEEDSAPLMIGTVGTPTIVAAPSRSTFQTNCIAIRLIQDATWAMTRAGRVAYVDAVTW